MRLTNWFQKPPMLGNVKRPPRWQPLVQTKEKKHERSSETIQNHLIDWLPSYRSRFREDRNQLNKGCPRNTVRKRVLSYGVCGNELYAATPLCLLAVFTHSYSQASQEMELTPLSGSMRCKAGWTTRRPLLCLMAVVEESTGPCRHRTNS